MVTVAQLLADPRLRLRAVHLPDPERRVEWVAATELLHPASYLEGSELVLTTGLAMAGVPAAVWASYADELVEGGAAALGLGTGIAFQAIPLELRRACERGGLNLLEVPHEVSFTAISRRVGAGQPRGGEPGSSGERADDRLVLAQLTRAAARGSDVAVLRALAACVHGEAALYSAHGQALSGPYGVGSLLDERLVVETISRIRSRGLRGAAGVEEGRVRLTVRPIGLTGEPGTYLVTAVDRDEAGPVHLAVELSWSLLNLAEESSRGRAAVLADLRAAGLRHLLEGRIREGLAVLGQVPGCQALGRTGTWRIAVALGEEGRGPALLQALARAAEGGTGASGPAGCLVWAPATRVDGGDGPDGPDGPDVSEGVLLAGPATAVDRLLAPPRRAGAAAAGGRGPASATGARAALTAALGAMRIGVSAPGRIETLSQARAQAAHAARGARGTGQVRDWGSLGGVDAIDLISPADARVLVTAQLRAVAERPELLELLEAYLAEGGATGRVASRLGIHRNSLPQRIRRLRRALGVDLDDATVRSNLWMALRLRERVGAD